MNTCWLFLTKKLRYFSQLFILGRGKKTEKHHSWVCVSATATTVVFLILWAVIKRVNIVKGLALTCLWMLLRVKGERKIEIFSVIMQLFFFFVFNSETLCFNEFSLLFSSSKTKFNQYLQQTVASSSNSFWISNK